MGAVLFFGGLIALLAIAFFLRNSMSIIVVTLVAIAVFPLYDWLASNSCEGGCNIRFDLLMVWPVLVILALLSVRMIFRWYRARKK